jgi:hypothetical protein
MNERRARLGLLRQDHAIADVVHFVGVILLIASCLWGWIYASVLRVPPPAGDVPT